ncbi:common plant regulatory factor 1-like isoform X2 [Primulina eburnea]|uniref:common plant regulatory factor 1-like isoform X2 n=1 Tax=Primulina eburnea TaxID=1245227 RepID=UPI003C6C2878
MHQCIQGDRRHVLDDVVVCLGAPFFSSSASLLLLLLLSPKRLIHNLERENVQPGLAAVGIYDLAFQLFANRVRGLLVAPTMGNSEEEKPCKTEALSSPAVDQNSFHVYPDWAAMQAFYGPRLAVPPYHNSVAASHAPPPYMWGPPQSMIPPYGAPYAAFYAHGGVYAHPGVHIAGTTLSMETPVKPPGNSDGRFVKKLKEFDGLAMSIGEGNDISADDAADNEVTQSVETEGASDGSNLSNEVTTGSGKKRSRTGSPNSAGNGKGKRLGQDSDKVVKVMPPANISAKTSENMSTALVLKDPSDFDVKLSPTSVPQTSKPGEALLQNERELKRERRKQSNRESARRSRLRKQAEHEELTIKVQALTSENMNIKSEINKLINNSEKLKLENATLMEKLKDVQLGQTEEVTIHEIGDFRPKPDGTVNLLARVNNNSDEGEVYENSSPGAKLHELLDKSPRTDAVAAI